MSYVVLYVNLTKVRSSQIKKVILSKCPTIVTAANLLTTFVTPKKSGSLNPSQFELRVGQGSVVPSLGGYEEVGGIRVLQYPNGESSSTLFGCFTISSDRNYFRFPPL